MRITPALATGLALLATAAVAQDFDAVEFRTTDLGGGLYLLQGRGGNIGVSSGPDGLFLVDDEYAPLGPKLRAALDAISPEPVRFVVNTHWHGDHSGGNERLSEARAVIVAHENVRRRMSQDQVMKAWDRTVPASPPSALPVVTFDDRVSFHLNGDDLEVFHVDPAHTDGDAIVRWRWGNLIHTGDTYVNGMYPFVDLDSGGHVDGILAACEKVLAMSDAKTRIIPGHGPLATRDDLERFVAMLKGVRVRIAALVAEGKSADEIVAARPTAEWDAEWGGGFLPPDRFTRFVALSLGAR